MADQTSKVKLIIDTEGANTSLKDMQKVARELRNELSKINDKNTPEYEEKVRQYQTVNNLVKTQQNEIRGIGVAMEANKSVFSQAFSFLKDRFVVSITDIGSIISAVLNFGSSSISASLKVSDAFADIQKATGMTKDEVAKLSAEIEKIDTRTAQENLLGIAKVGGQIGVARNEMLGFVESVDKAVVALGDEFSGGAEEVAQKMGVLKNLFKETKDLDAGDAINKIGSAINELGAAGSATGPVVAEFATRIGQLGNLAPQINETLGLGAAFQELGLSAEISAGGITNIMLGAAKSTALYAKQLGMTDAEFKKLLNTDPNKFFLKLAESMKGMSNTQVVKTLDDLGIKSQEATKVMSLLANQTDLVREKQALAGKAMKEATSLTNEFNIKNNTAKAELEKAGKAIDNMKVELGTGLLPVVTKVISGFISFINIIRAIPAFVSENKVMFLALGVAIASFNFNLIAATTASLYSAAALKAQAIATSATTLAQRALNLAMSANPIGAVIAVIALVVGAFVTWYNKSETLRATIAGLWATTKTLVNMIKEAVVAFATFDFDKISDLFKNGAKKLAGSFGSAYNEKLKEGHAEDKAAHKKNLDDKTADTKKGATQAATASVSAHADGLKQEAKQAAEHRKKEAEERLKDEKAALSAIDEIRIESIKNDVARDTERLRTKNAKELEQVAASKATEATKAAWTLALREKLDRDIKALEDKALKQRLDDEKKANEIIDAMFEKSAQNQYQIETAKLKKKYAENVNHINQLQLDEARKNELLLKLDAQYLQADEAMQKEHQAKLLSEENKIQQTRIKSEYEANKAINDAELLLAGNNIEAIKKAKIRGLKINYDNTLANLKAEYEAEKANAEASGQTTELIDKKYNALKLAAHLNHEADKKKIEDERLQARADRNKALYDGISALMKGDLAAFGQGMATKLGLEKSNFTAKQQMQMKDAAQVMQLAQEGVEFLKRKNEEKLKNTLDNLKKEFDGKKKTSADEYKMITDGLEAERKSELAKANLSAAEREAINKKFNLALEKNRDSHEKFMAGLDKDLAAKEKEARLKSFEQQKKLNITTAVINGAQAVLMALATTPFPLNIGVGAIIAAKTIIDVNKIKNQPKPEFAMGKSPNFINNAGVVDGPSHRDGGVSLVDNQTGEIKGVVEGYEPLAVFNKTLYKNNRGIIDLLLHKSLKGDHAPIFEMGRNPYENEDEAPRPSFRQTPNNPVESSASVSESSGSEASSGSSGGGAGEGISQSEVEAMTANSTNLMQSIAQNTAPISQLVGLVSDVKNGIDGLNSKFDAFPRELRATVSFQETSQANSQAAEAQNSNVISGG